MRFRQKPVNLRMIIAEIEFPKYSMYEKGGKHMLKVAWLQKASAEWYCLKCRRGEYSKGHPLRGPARVPPVVSKCIFRDNHTSDFLARGQPRPFKWPRGLILVFNGHSLGPACRHTPEESILKAIGGVNP